MTTSDAILAKYTFPAEIQNLNANLDLIVDTSVNFLNYDDLLLMFSLLDLTSLNAIDTPSGIAKMAEKVNNFHNFYPNMPNVAAICVYPAMIPIVKQNLKVENVGIASVTGGFPASQTFLEVKVVETYTALDRGATETDMVISIGKVLDSDLYSVFEDVEALKQVSGTAHLKVILETGALETPELIWKTSILAMEAGADFIKTSTGKIQPAATLEAAYVMCLAIREFNNKNNKKVGFKPAGGISTAQVAARYFAVVNNVLGKEWLNNHLFRIGASSLANNILNEVAKLSSTTTIDEIKYF